MSVVTLQSFKTIDRLEMGKLGAWSSNFVGAQWIHVLDGTTNQVEFILFERKVVFSIFDVPERFKESISWFPANFNFSRKSVKVKFLTYHVTRPHIELKFKPFSKHALITSIWTGFIYSVLMPEVTLKKVFFDDWPSRSRFNVKFQNQKLAKYGEFNSALVSALV